MLMRRFSMMLLAGLVWGATTSALANDGAVVDRWYAALLAADRAGLSELLSDDAHIDLADLGIQQDKQEFLGSIDEWEASVKGAAIRHRIEKNEGATSIIIVCYDFPGNDVLMRETFEISGGRIAASSQAAVAENCDSL